MTVYLDNNIIVSIENGDYSLADVIKVLPKDEVRFFYSAAHIFEIENFQGSIKISKSELLNKRFETIRTIFKNNYLYLDLENNSLLHLIQDPQEVYETITSVYFGIEVMKKFSSLLSKEQKEEIRKQLGIEIQKLNNYTPFQVIEHLNQKLEILGNNYSIVEMIEHGIQLFGQEGKNFGLHNRIAGIFDLLDLCGYWKDKETSKSNYARLWDSNHTFFASYCDFFISDDKRTKNKASVVFHIYNKKTKILSTSNV